MKSEKMGFNQKCDQQQPTVKSLALRPLAAWASLLLWSGISALGGQLLQNAGFENAARGTYRAGARVAGWLVTSNEVSVMTEPAFPSTGSNYLALSTGRLTRTFATVPGVAYELRCWASSPGLTAWWPANNSTADIVGANDGTIPYSDVTYGDGEVARAFKFTLTLQAATIPPIAIPLQ